MDAEGFKARQRETWALGDFGQLATFTIPVAGHLCAFAGVREGQAVLDVGTGTGVVALTARRLGANVTALDLTPELLEKARASAAELGLEGVAWHEGDAEALPFADASFDVVLSQFGHIFAPRPDVAIREMLRVLRPGGTIAFATWPPEQLMGRSFAIGARYLPLPEGVPPPSFWGDPNVVEERLSWRVKDLFFERGVLRWPALSVRHFRSRQETWGGPAIRAVKALSADPEKLAAWRRDLEAVAEPYFRDNVLCAEYLLSRARKA